MNKCFFIKYLAVFLFLLSSCFSYALNDQKIGYDAVYGENGPAFTVVTGSPGDLGLLKALAEPFCTAKRCRINWLKKGSGESLKALKEGKVDMVMTHSP
jgi:tungstate transport system substrate-binding protein